MVGEVGARSKGFERINKETLVNSSSHKQPKEIQEKERHDSTTRVTIIIQVSIIQHTTYK
jgi:hypothetical protein